VDVESAKNVLDRTRAIVEARALPEKEAVAAAQQLRQAELSFGVASSKLASLDITSKSENEFIVHAPRAGRVVEKNVLPGQELTPGAETALMLVADLSTVWVVADVYEKDFARVRVGSTASVTTKAYPDVVLPGRVSYIDPQVSPTTRTAQARIDVGAPAARAAGTARLQDGRRVIGLAFARVHDAQRAESGYAQGGCLAGFVGALHCTMTARCCSGKRR